MLFLPKPADKEAQSPLTPEASPLNEF